MKTTTSLLAAAAAVLGLGAGAAAFQMTASHGSDLTPTSQTVTKGDKPTVKVPKIHAGTQFQWAPCKPPAVQQGDACVVEEVHTVVVPAAPQAPAGGSTSGGSTYGGDDSDGPVTHPSDDSDEPDEVDEPEESDDDGSEEPEDEPEDEPGND